jgi:hypothetical protein
MGKQRRIWLAIVLAVVFGGGAWLLLPAREPVYEGRPLSYWLAGYDHWMTDPPREKVDAAVREAGDRALPILVRMLRARDSSLTVKLIGLAQMQHFVAIDHVPATTLNLEAQAAFRTLGPAASNAVPALIKILEEHRSVDSDVGIEDTLAGMGPAAARAVAVLLQSASNPAPAVRCSSVWALRCIRAEPEKVVPALTRGLGDTNFWVRAGVVEALGTFGAAAKPAVPALVAAAGDQQIMLHDAVLAALKKIDPAAAAALIREK